MFANSSIHCQKTQTETCPTKAKMCASLFTWDADAAAARSNKLRSCLKNKKTGPTKKKTVTFKETTISLDLPGSLQWQWGEYTTDWGKLEKTARHYRQPLTQQSGSTPLVYRECGNPLCYRGDHEGNNPHCLCENGLRSPEGCLLFPLALSMDDPDCWVEEGSIWINTATGRTLRHMPRCKNEVWEKPVLPPQDIPEDIHQAAQIAKMAIEEDEFTCKDTQGTTWIFQIDKVSESTQHDLLSRHKSFQEKLEAAIDSEDFISAHIISQEQSGSDQQIWKSVRIHGGRPAIPEFGPVKIQDLKESPVSIKMLQGKTTDSDLLWSNLVVGNWKKWLPIIFGKTEEDVANIREKVREKLAGDIGQKFWTAVDQAWIKQNTKRANDGLILPKYKQCCLNKAALHASSSKTPINDMIRDYEVRDLFRVEVGAIEACEQKESYSLEFKKQFQLMKSAFLQMCKDALRGQLTDGRISKKEFLTRLANSANLHASDMESGKAKIQFGGGSALPGKGHYTPADGCFMNIIYREIAQQAMDA